MKPLSLVLILTLQFGTSLAMAQTPYDRLEKLYQAARSPGDLNSVFGKVKMLKGCSEVNAAYPEYPMAIKKLTLAEYTVPANGPLFPGKKTNAIVMVYNSGNIGRNDLSHFDLIRRFKPTLTANELQLSTTLIHSQPKECERYTLLPDGDLIENEDCNGQLEEGIFPLQVNLRTDAQHIYYQMQDTEKNNIYGYCWK